MDPFAILGLQRVFSVDLSAVERTHRELSRTLHPDKFVGASASERRASLSKAVEVNEAWRIVRDPIRRAEALLSLAGIAVGERNEPNAAPDFLMEVMDQREALAEARAKNDASAIKKLASEVEVRAKAVEQSLARGFDGTPRASEEALVALVPALGELRFYRRFLEEVGALQDEMDERSAQNGAR